MYFPVTLQPFKFGGSVNFCLSFWRLQFPFIHRLATHRSQPPRSRPWKSSCHVSDVWDSSAKPETDSRWNRRSLSFLLSALSQLLPSSISRWGDERQRRLRVSHLCPILRRVWVFCLRSWRCCRKRGAAASTWRHFCAVQIGRRWRHRDCGRGQDKNPFTFLFQGDYTKDCE